MAVHGPIPLTYTLVSAANLTAAQFAPLAVDANGRVVLANITSNLFVGVLENKPNSLEHASIALGPAVTKGRVGLAVTRLDYLTIQSGWFIAGVKATYNASLWTNQGCVATTLYGLALETVTSGGVATIKLFEKPGQVSSN